MTEETVEEVEVQDVSDELITKCGYCLDGEHGLCNGEYWWEPPPHMNAQRRQGECSCDEGDHPGRPVAVEAPEPGPSLEEVEAEQAKAAKATAKSEAARKPDEGRGRSSSSSSRTK